MTHRYTRTGPCADCGASVTKRWRYDRDNLCIECSLRRAIVGVESMANRSGAAYERFRRNRKPRGPARKDTEG